ncbi:phosphoglucosamine mutase, partial [Patescibacteria group bacterium]|nr:phosphoglucosamine mutase [Patescibacteria group bacterium]
MEKFILDKKEQDKKIAVKKCVLKKTGERYLEFLLICLPKDFNLKGDRIVLDCANGATYRIALKIFRKLGAEIIVIGDKPYGRNINENCGSEHLERLQKAVKKYKAQAGLAFDGDGDRLRVVDEKGKILTGDHVLYIIGRMLLEKGELDNKKIVSTIMSNIGFVKALENIGVKHIQTDVGDQKVYDAMKREGAIIGGEESGHIIFSKYHTTGDGILTALMLMQAFKYFN